MLGSGDLKGDVLAATVPAFDLQGAAFNQVNLFFETLKLSDSNTLSLFSLWQDII